MATIKEDYVSFETAKLLKKKGFDVDECEVHYDPLDHTQYEITLQMAMKWLREVHNMYYEIKLLLGEKAEKYGDLQLGIYQLSSSGAYVWKDWIYADTYVELYENYIKYCLEHLI